MLPHTTSAVSAFSEDDAGRPTQFASKTRIGTTGRFLCSIASKGTHSLSRTRYIALYALRMGQPTQRATNSTARSNIEPAQIFLPANGQSAPRSGGARDVGQRRGEPHTEHGLGVLHELPALTALAQHITHSHSGIDDEMRPTEKCVGRRADYEARRPKRVFCPY